MVLLLECCGQPFPTAPIQAHVQAEGVEASVSGRLPPWLAGDFLRNGPGNYEGMQHMFDGFSLLAKVEVDGATNSARASHRFLQASAPLGGRVAGRAGVCMAGA